MTEKHDIAYGILLAAGTGFGIWLLVQIHKIRKHL